MARGEQGNEIGSSSNQSGEVAEETSIDIDRATRCVPFLPQWLRDATDEKRDELEAEKDLTKKPVCKIQRVPPIFRKPDSSGKDNYDPLIISLGPFHHGKQNLERMEKLKISMMRGFIKGTEKPVEEVYGKFLDVARNAKKEYYVLEGEDDIDNDSFLHILFVDVCFLIQFILACVAIGENVVTGEYELDTHMTNHDIAYLPRDLFLLENQLPFPIVKALMMLRFSTEDEIFRIIHEFISNEVRIQPTRSPWHRIWWMEDMDAYHDHADSEPLHLLHALQMQLSGPEKLIPERHGLMWYSYRSVKELKAAGIHFSPQSGYSRHLTDVRFHSMLVYGVLSLKPTVIDGQTKARFLNLCAFEALPNAPGDFEVTSYLCFMDSLIETAEDVQELRSRGILFNFLGTDQLVADMFNDIADGLVTYLEAFGKVKLAIESHCNSNARRWFNEVLYKRFTTPNWTIIGFLFAAFAIVLSIIQTFILYKPHTSK